MTIESAEFLVHRFSLVEEAQGALTPHPIPSPKGSAVLAAIMGDPEFKSKGARFGFVGFAEASLRENVADRYYIGKLAKLKSARVGRKIPGDIVEVREDDWIAAIAVFDIESQHIFIEKQWKFGPPERIISILQDGLRAPVLSKYNLRVFVEARTGKEHFWRVIQTHRRLYNLELKLISPNILETNISAREALASLKALFSQDSATLKLQNESGELKVPETPVADYLEYIEEGEGSWSLTTEGTRGRGKKRHKSTDSLKTVELPIPNESTRPQQMRIDEPESVFERMSREAGLLSAINEHVSRFRER